MREPEVHCASIASALVGRQTPFLPVPPREYLAFRSLTQYGETQRPPSPEDVVDYLAWCREWDRALRR